MQLFAVSVDAPEDSRRVVEAFELPFPILADVDRTVVRDYGLLHQDGHGGTDIAIPSLWLLRADGTVAWRRIAGKLTDRPSPEEVLAEVEARLAP